MAGHIFETKIDPAALKALGAGAGWRLYQDAASGHFYLDTYPYGFAPGNPFGKLDQELSLDFVLPPELASLTALHAALLAQGFSAAVPKSSISFGLRLSLTLSRRLITFYGTSGTEFAGVIDSGHLVEAWMKAPGWTAEFALGRLRVQCPAAQTAMLENVRQRVFDLVLEEQPVFSEESPLRRAAVRWNIPPYNELSLVDERSEPARPVRTHAASTHVPAASPRKFVLNGYVVLETLGFWGIAAAWVWGTFDPAIAVSLSILLGIQWAESAYNAQTGLTPNQIIFPGLLTGCSLTYAMHVFKQPQLGGGLIWHLGAPFATFTVLLLIAYILEKRWRKDAIGGGTIKLFAMIAAYLGFWTVPALLMSILFFLILAKLSRKGRLGNWVQRATGSVDLETLSASRVILAATLATLFIASHFSLNVK